MSNMSKSANYKVYGNKTTQNKIRKLLIEVWQVLPQIKTNNGVKEIEIGFLNENIKRAQIRDLWEI